jgi:DNA-binding transcriptional MocR family regulator
MRRNSSERCLAKTVAAPPSTTLSWSAAGLHVTVALLAPHDEQAIRVATQARGVTMGVLGDYQPHAAFPPTLILGYSQLTGRAIVEGVREIGAAIRTTQG